MKGATNKDSRDKFSERIREWATRLDVRVRSVTIRKMRRKWASCSTAGRLTFDESLLSKPRDLQDYVIVHQLLHVRVPQSRQAMGELDAYLGDYKGLEARLIRRVGD